MLILTTLTDEHDGIVLVLINAKGDAHRGAGFVERLATAQQLFLTASSEVDPRNPAPLERVSLTWRRPTR